MVYLHWTAAGFCQYYWVSNEKLIATGVSKGRYWQKFIIKNNCICYISHRSGDPYPYKQGLDVAYTTNLTTINNYNTVLK